MPTPLVTDPRAIYDSLCAYRTGVVTEEGWLALARMLELHALRVEPARQASLNDRATDCRHRAARVASLVKASEGKTPSEAGSLQEVA